MTELYFVRHGRTAENTAKRFQGHSDTELDDVGRWQARRVAQRLTDYGIGALYTSDLARARQTAAPIAAAIGTAASARDDLREIDVGDATGLTKDELMRHHPALFGDDWHRVPFPGGESYEQTAARMRRAGGEIAAAHADQRVVVVTHGGAIRAAIAGIVGIPIQTLAGLFVINTSITCISVADDGRGKLRGLNDAAHLESWADTILEA